MKKLKNCNSIYFSCYWHYLSLAILTPVLVSSFNSQPLQAETVETTQAPNETSQTTPTQPPRDIIRPPAPPLPEPGTPSEVPPPEELLPTPAPTAPTPTSPEVLPTQVPENITVERFEVVGSTIFSQKQLAETTAPYTNKQITFAELLQAADAITKLYTDKGYINSGAFIPASQTFQNQGGVVRIEVVEGSIEDIRVTGTRRLKPDYVRSRIAVATGKPLNINKLQEALQLLELNPVIETIRVELATGTRPGTSILDVRVTEAKNFSATANLNNNRVPTVGTFERQISLNSANLLGFGDGLGFTYSNTDGSNTFDISYSLPVNPRNGTLGLNYINASTRVIQPPFDILGIEGDFQEYGVSFRQPLVESPTREFAVGVSFSRRESDIGFLESLTGERFPFPSPGADSEGRTRISALRLFQDYVQRNNQQVIAARSQFSFGLPLFNATTNNIGPDATFVAWRGQGQYVRAVAPDTLIVLRGDVQLSANPLLPLEQIGVGGQNTVRGYRQDLLLTDNGFVGSAEFRYPVWRVPQLNGLLQVTPFFDFGIAWNNSDNLTAAENNTLGSVGLGLRWTQGNNLGARLDYGIPLFNVPESRRTLQEKGLHFSIFYTQSF